jgi:photosystem II stability/assembly factor-like uncharacterized protein
MSHRLLVATRKGLFTVLRHGAGDWRIAESAFLGVPLSMVLADARTGREYAALDHGHFGVKLHARRHGDEWQEITCPAYPPQPEGVEDKNPFTGAAIPWKVQKIWSLEAGGADQPGRLWCGTAPGGLFRSDDDGQTWNLAHSLWEHPGRKAWFGGGTDLPALHSICVDPRDSRRVRVAVSCGGVWETRDDGQSWECRAEGMWAAYMPPEQAREPNIQDVHRLVQCPAAPEAFWAQHHNGIFRSTDDGATWQEVKDGAPTTFGFAVAVHPRDPQTAWFVPAISDERRIPVGGQVVVSRTRDGGKTFDVLRAGLPQEHAYDITFRHALDVDAYGQCLAFGSTTGSLWISEDAGDSFQRLSHLPPIYCVRFV